MRIVVTGGAGFIGSHLVDSFLSAGHEVFVVDDLSSGNRGVMPEDVPFIEGDIRDGYTQAAVQDIAPNVVCHHAAQINVRKSADDPALDADVNVLGLIGILEAAKGGGCLEHVMFASSGGAIYGEQSTHPATEDHPVAPMSPYGVSKLVGEKYLQLYNRMFGISYTALRYANVYGPRQSPHGEAGVIAIFTEKILEGKGININGDGEQTRDFVYVKDVVTANLLALRDRPVGVFNIGTGIETSVNQIANGIMTGLATRAEVAHRASAPGEQRRSSIDSSLFERTTGFRPRIEFKEGLKDYIESVHL